MCCRSDYVIEMRLNNMFDGYAHRIMNPLLFRLLPALVALTLSSGCAFWTGGIPDSYSKTEKYPVIASVHGIKHVTYSDDLHNIVVSYIPTNEIILSTNTTHGWLIHIQPTDKQLVGEEFYILPKAARWSIRSRMVSIDRTTCRTDFIVPKGAKYIGEDWGMFSDDPLGEYEIVVFLDHKLASDFRFCVVGNLKSARDRP